MRTKTEPGAPSGGSAGDLDHVVRLRKVSKGFPGVQALEDVDLDLAPGKVHALLGENGAGKSTLIKVLSGVYRPDAGAVEIEGDDVVLEGPAQAQELGIATIHQELLQFPDLSVAENIFLGHPPMRSMRRIDWRGMRERARELLDQLGAFDIGVDTPVGSLSVGNRQRVEIAKAMSLSARVLVMDEPTAALTDHDVTTLFETVRLLCQRGVSVAYITHRLDEVFEIADHVTVLRDGRRIATSDVADTDTDALVNWMVGRSIDVLYPGGEGKPGEVVLELRKLRRFSTSPEVSFTVRSGEIVGLAGLVGAGRSELAQAIFGIEPCFAGELLVSGEKVSIRSPEEARAHGIAYIPEDRGIQGLVKPMTVRENATMAILDQVSRAMVIDRRAEAKVADGIIDRFGVRTPSAAQVVGRLSGGNQQKIVIGKWLATKPKVLIMDEPTRGIDIGAKSEIHRLMTDLTAGGMAVLMISSDLPEVIGMSDRVVVMASDKVVAEFTGDEATEENVGAAMMHEYGG